MAGNAKYVLEIDTAANAQAGKCRVEVWPGKPIIIVISELPDNQGMSVTNGIEHIASAVISKLQIHNTPIVWIEHYPVSELRGEETFDLVTFAHDNAYTGGALIVRQAGWRPLTKSAVRQLIGSKREAML